MSYQEEIVRFVDLVETKKLLEAQVKDIDKELKPLEESLLEHFIEMGQQSTKVNGRTVYLHRQWWTGPIKDANGDSDYDTSTRALIAAGLGRMVQTRFNSQTVSAWVRELPTDELGVPILPPEVEGKLLVQKTVALRTRSS